MAKIAGFPQRAIRDSDEVESERKARAEAQQEAAAQERANGEADRASKMGSSIAQLQQAQAAQAG